MNNMFRSFTLALAAVATVSFFIMDSGLAQGFGGGGPGQFEARIQAETDSIIALLKPTPEQSEAVAAILAARAEQLADARPQQRGARGGFQAMREKMATIEEQTLVALTPLLSEEQLEAYKTYMQSRRDRQQQRMRGRGQSQ